MIATKMQLKNTFLFWIFLLSLIVAKGHKNKEALNSFDFHVNQALDDAIQRFDDIQGEKMIQGFTSNARRSYKKTKQ